MVSLWVLVILAMLVVSIGHRVSMSLRLSRYHRDSLIAFCLAKTEINRAIIEILNNRTPDTVTDEESKININTAPRGLLIELLNKVKADNPSVIANNICAWRGDLEAGVVDYQDLGYSNKGNKFLRAEELVLVKGVTLEICNSLKKLVTVYGLGKININTAPAEVLEILAAYCVKQGADLNFPTDLSAKIIMLRGQGEVFETLADLKMEFTQGQSDILNNLVGTESTCFYIVSDGKIKVVFDRSSKKIIYWYES